MPVTVGGVVVDLSANSASFKADLGKSAAALKSSSARMNRSLGKIDRGFRGVTRSVAAFVKRTVSLRGIVATVAGGAGLGLLVKSALDTADSIAKTADAIGVSTAALQEYRFALGIAGVETAATDKGLKKFTRNMGELARTSSETQTSLKDLDPALLANLRSLKTVEDQLALGFRALAGYADQTKRAAVAQALFGRAGIDMTLGIKDGIAAFVAMREEARRLGLVIDDALLRGAEKAKDELSILGQVLKVKVTVAILANARAIADLATQLTESIPKVIEFVREWAKFFGLIKENEVLQLQKDLDPLIKKIDEIRQRLHQGGLTESRRIGFNRRLNVLLAEQERIVARINAARAKGRAGAADAGKGKGAGAAEETTAAVAAGVLTAAQKKAQAAQERFDAIRRRQQQPLIDFDEIFEDKRGIFEEAVRRAADAKRVFEETRTPVEVFGKRVGELKALLDDSAISQDVFNRATAQARERLEATSAATIKATTTVAGLSRGLRDYEKSAVDAAANAETAVVSSFRSMEDALVRFVQTGKLNFRDFVNSVIAESARMAIRENITGPLSGLLQGAVKSLFPGPGVAAGAAASAGFFTAAPFAHGGRVTVGGAGGTDSKIAVLRVSPREDITVRTPAQQKAARGAGFTFIDNSVTTIDARGADAGVERLIRDAMERTQAATVAKVRDLVERGGRYSESFGG